MTKVFDLEFLRPFDATPVSGELGDFHRKSAARITSEYANSFNDPC